jgi:hypothetical protein
MQQHEDTHIKRSIQQGCQYEDTIMPALQGVSEEPDGPLVYQALSY